VTYWNHRYKTARGNELTVLAENGGLVLFVVERPERVGCQTKVMPVVEFAAKVESGEHVFVREGMFILSNERIKK
jgi:hypothetical protein